MSLVDIMLQSGPFKAFLEDVRIVKKEAQDINLHVADLVVQNEALVKSNKEMMKIIKQLKKDIKK